MKWVKASERLPEKQHNYHVKVGYDYNGAQGIWNTASLWNGNHWEHPNDYESWTGKPKKLNVIEWLDESQEDGQKDEWISVEERLPKIRIPVFVWMKDGEWEDCCIAERTIKSEWYRPFKHVSDVTHWQPLPKPPIK